MIELKSFECKRCGREAGKYLVSPPAPKKRFCADCLLWQRRTVGQIVGRAKAGDPSYPITKP